MPAKLFCLTLPKKIVQEPFSVSLISGIEKFYALEGYVTIFYRIFLSDSAEISVGKPFIVSLISGIEKVWIRGGGGGRSIKILRRKFFVSECRKLLWWKHCVLCFTKFPRATKFMDQRRGGEYQGFRRKLFVSQFRKFS